MYSGHLYTDAIVDLQLELNCLSPSFVCPDFIDVLSAFHKTIQHILSYMHY